jgi:exodeoxyribonuclease V gamma subunit
MTKNHTHNFTQKCPLRVVFGNDMNGLAHQLGEDFFSSPSHPFENRLIVVPDRSMKEFLLHSFVAHPRLKIAAGIQIVPLNQAMVETIDFKKKIPSFLELSLAIEEKLHAIAAKKNGGDSLLKYLNEDSEEKKCRRISSLSDELAKLFGRYGLYGATFLPKWLSEESQGWQQLLWRELFSDHSPWTYPLEALDRVQPKDFLGKIALFGFSYIPPIHLSFFSSLGASLYQLSPCSLFWEDMASDKQRLYISKILAKKGVKENLREEIEGYMQNSHPLLGNWGKLGREMLKSLDEFELIEEEVYGEPKEGSLLAALKKSLLTLDESCPISLDDSIQLHSATSRLREVEILRDLLETFVQTHLQKGDSISPGEILVVSADIALYIPYIQMVFAQSPFSYAIESVPISYISQTVQGFLQLLNLKKEQFALSAVIKLFQCLPFMEKSGFAFDEITQLSKWFKQAEIRRGLYRAQEGLVNSGLCETKPNRSEAVRMRSPSLNGKGDEEDRFGKVAASPNFPNLTERGISSHLNSWEAGIDRLLLGMALIPSEEDDFESWPVAAIPQSEIDLFNRFLELFEKIKNDLSQLTGEKGAVEWIEIFLRMADHYFLLKWENEPFFQELKKLSLSCRGFKGEIWNFETIERVLLHLAQRPTSEISSSQLQKVTFTSLKPGSVRPARIVWCLGMDEEAFPRVDSRSSLCEMTRLKASDYYLSKSDEERTLFLDLLLKAEDHLIFSYLRIHHEDAKQQGPSILIEELNHYLIKRGDFDGIPCFDHPAFPFDQIYFSAEGRVKKWSESDFKAAKAHYSPPIPLSPFFNIKSHPSRSDVAKELVIDIRELKKLARHPIQFYFNETLKIYLDEEKDEEEKEFLISHLRKSIFRKKAMKRSLPQMMQQWRGKGKLPSGLFQDAALHDIEGEMEDLLGHLNGFGIDPREIGSIHLSPSCLAHEKTETILPPLSIPLNGSRIAHIIGELEDLTPQGLLFHGESDLKSLVKAWPLYLISLCLNPERAQLLLTKKGEVFEAPIVDPSAALSSYIEYFLLAKSSPSPLMPDWAAPLLQKTEADFAKAISKELTYDDAYLSYLHRRQGVFDPKEVFALWKEPLRKVFAPLLQGGDDGL